jgi:hypothetical protein
MPVSIQMLITFASHVMWRVVLVHLPETPLVAHAHQVTILNGLVLRASMTVMMASTVIR